MLDLAVVVAVDLEITGPRATYVASDSLGGARLAVRHLHGLGHRRVWHVAGPERSYSATGRREAWEQTLRAHGAEVPPVLVGGAVADVTLELRGSKLRLCARLRSARTNSKAMAAPMLWPKMKIFSWSTKSYFFSEASA